MEIRKEFINQLPKKDLEKSVIVERTFTCKICERDIKIDVWNDKYVYWLEQKLQASEKASNCNLADVRFSEERAEVCKRNEHWKECITWIDECRCIKACDFHKQT